jgi:hypothetical protein
MAGCVSEYGAGIIFAGFWMDGKTGVVWSKAAYGSTVRKVEK